jgi:hypothetical protein
MSTSQPAPEAPFASLEAALAVVERTPAVLRQLIEGLDATILQAPPGAEGTAPWGPRQVAEHLLDTEDIAFMQRVRRVTEAAESGERPFIRSIDPPARLVDGGYAARSLDDLLDELQRRRAGDVAWVRALAPEALAGEGEHDRAGVFAARELLHYWACHDLLHLRQILVALQDTLAPFVGNLARFFEEV